MTTKLTKENIDLICRIVSSLFAGRYPLHRTVTCSVGAVKHGLKIALSRSYNDSNGLVIPYEAEFTCSDAVLENAEKKTDIPLCDALIVFRWADVKLSATPWDYEIRLEDTVPKYAVESA